MARRAVVNYGRMEVERRQRETQRVWTPKETRRSDEVGRPIFDARVPVAAPRAEPGDRLAREIRDYEAIVAQELRLGRDPEAYWNQLSSNYDALSARRREVVASGDVGAEAGREAAVTRKLRYEMNALIPRLAHARVRADLSRFSGADGYVAHLERQLAHAEGTAASAEGDEAALRGAIDVARILREQIAEVRRIAPAPEDWRRLRAEAFGGRMHSVLEELPPGAVEAVTWRDELEGLRAKRAALKFWQVFQKAELAEKIAVLERRAAREEKKSKIVAAGR